MNDFRLPPFIALMSISIIGLDHDGGSLSMTPVSCSSQCEPWSGIRHFTGFTLTAASGRTILKRDDGQGTIRYSGQCGYFVCLYSFQCIITSAVVYNCWIIILRIGFSEMREDVSIVYHILNCKRAGNIAVDVHRVNGLGFRTW
jgi:hypothetical protein